MKRNPQETHFTIPRWPLTLILVLGVLFSVYLFTLINDYLGSQEELKTAAAEQLRTETESRAAELGYFFSDALSSVQALATARELSTFFANKALKMSMKYGLSANLVLLEAKFKEVLEEKTRQGSNIFSRLVFVNEDATLLTDTREPEYDEGVDWQPYLTPAEQEPRLLTEPIHNQFLVSTPYIYKGQFKGQILGWIAAESLAYYLLSRPQVQQDAIYNWNGRLLAVNGTWNNLLPMVSDRVQRMPHDEVLSLEVDEQDSLVNMLAVKVLLPGINYYLVTVRSEDRSLTQGTSRALLFAGGLLPFLATIGLLVFAYLRRVNDTLRKRYLESLDQRQKLADEVRSRKSIERQLRTHQDVIMQRSFELKKTMVALQESQQLLSEAQQIAHVGSWKFDHSSKELTWSNEVYSILGLDPSQVEANYQTFLSAVHPEDRERVDTTHSAALKADGQWEITHRICQPNGETRVARQLSKRLMESGSSQIVTIGVIHDITEQTEAEADQARLQRELKQAHKMEALGQLTGGIAHDFNNSLGIILGYTALARERGLSAGEKQLKGYLEKVELAGERAKNLISQMLAFSRSGDASAKPLFLQQLVKEDLKLLRPSLPSSIQIQSDIESELPAVMIDPVHINQLLMNLSINARDAMNGAGAIHYRLGMAQNLDTECDCCHRRVVGDWVELSVTDTGKGIEPRVLNRLFEPFFTTKEIGKGTGMGLAVVHGIVSQHGGRILVDTDPGKGTRFRLLFPPTNATQGGLGESEATNSPVAMPEGGGQHVLIVDDEPALADYIAELLELYGYRTTIRTESLDALQLIRQDPQAFSLLITDQTMPGMTGLQLIREVRKTLPGVPTILCTGYSEAIDQEKAQRLGVCYLGKPIDTGQLLKAVDRQLAESMDSEYTPRTASLG